MCAFCFASLALIIGSTASTGGLMALVLKGLRENQRKITKETKIEERYETRKDKNQNRGDQL
jgi:hypothetical protein